MRANRILFFTVILIVAVLTAYYIPRVHPNLLFSAVFGLLVGLISFFKLEIGIYIIVFSMLLSPEIKLAQVPGRDVVIRVDDFILVIVFFSWFARVAIDKGIGLLKKTPLNAPVIAYVSACIIFTLKGIITGEVDALKSFFYVLKYVEYFLLFFMVSNVVKDEKDVKRYLKGALITLAIVTINGYIQIGAGLRVNAPFEDPLGGAVTGGEPASIGGYMVICLAIFISIILNMSNPLQKVMAGLAFIVMIPPFFQTLSRASYTAFAVMVLAVFIFTKKYRWIFGAVILAAIVAVPVLTPGNISERVFETFEGRKVSTSFGQITLDESSMERIDSWNNLIRNKLPKHLLTGFGVTGAGFIDGQYFTVLGEVGLIGFGLFLWMLFSIYRLSWKTYRFGKTDFARAIAFGCFVSFMALLIHAVTANTFIVVRIMEPFWFLTALVAVLYRENSENTSIKKDLKL